jgi:hypothetical protein
MEGGGRKPSEFPESWRKPSNWPAPDRRQCQGLAVAAQSGPERFFQSDETMDRNFKIERLLDELADWRFRRFGTTSGSRW